MNSRRWRNGGWATIFSAPAISWTRKEITSRFFKTNWQGSPLVYPAQMMAGRAAIGRLGYSDAIGYFTALDG
jgi:hypothetical protein